MKFRVFWDVLRCSQVDVDRRFRGAYCFIALMMEVVRTSETSVNIYLTTRQYIPEDSKLNYFILVLIIYGFLPKSMI
jgi:hypothetical protein